MGGGGAEKAASVLLSTKAFLQSYEIHAALFDNNIKYSLPPEITLHIADKNYTADSKTSKALSIPGWVSFLRSVKKLIKPHISLSFLTRANIINIVTKTESEKVVVSERNDPTHTYGPNPLVKFLHKNMIMRYYPKADKIIAVSEGVKRELVRYACLDPLRITAVNNPYDIDKIKNLSREPLEEEYQALFRKRNLIVSTGRLIRQKGHDILIKALPKISTEPPAEVVIIGTGELEPSLKKLAAEIGFKDRVHFLGWQDNPFRYESKADVFVLPSRWEGFPNALVEAMACGSPVIASNSSGGTKEIIGKDTYGMLFNNEQPEDLAAKLQQVLQNQELLNKYKNLSLERASHFHKDIIAEKYLKELEI